MDQPSNLPRSILRNVIPAALIAAAARPGASGRSRLAAAGALVGFWSLIYARYRRNGTASTRREFELLAGVNWEAFWRHYNERVPTVEEEFELWGTYHQHRHEMRYDLVADEVRRHLPPGGTVLDVGCGGALVADRIQDVPARYIGFDFGGHHIQYAAKKFADVRAPLAARFVRGDAEQMPFADASVDVVVMSEVIEHLIRPELAVWEVARVLRPSGVYIMTTNNASEVPCISPLSHVLAWVEKGVGAEHPALISYRPWVWPWPVDREVLPEGSPDVYVPHTHHIMAETRDLFAAAGIDTFQWSTFEFPPPQAVISKRLEKMGAAGRRAVDALEWVCQRTPGVRRLGAHHLMLSRKNRPPVASTPPRSVWPGPFSGDAPVPR